MNTILPLEYDTYYHIYNRGINGENLFRECDNYWHFLKLYDEIINPVAKRLAWCLMKNHFHLLVKILPEESIGYITPSQDDNRTFRDKKKYNPSRQFANLFNAYAKAFNKRYQRTGGLFETPFHRIKVKDNDYLMLLVHYIHRNPIKHGFVSSIPDYAWSSYNEIISNTYSDTNKVIELFGSREEFIEFHNREKLGVDWERF